MRSISKITRAALAAVVLSASAGACVADDGAPIDDAAPDGQVGVEGLGFGDHGEDVEWLHQTLTQRGYFPNAALSESFPAWVPVVAEGPAEPAVFDERTEEAVAAFQAQHGLEPTSVVDEATMEMLEQPHCGNPAHDWDGGDKWHHDAMWSDPWERGRTFTYRIEGTPTGWSQTQTRTAVDAAFSLWESVIGTNFVFTSSSSSDAIIRFTTIDGPVSSGGSILGQTYNNFWGGHRYTIEIDTAENWSATGVSNVSATMVHEIGHLLGLNHSSIGGAIMFPSVSMVSDGVLSDDDRAAITFRYRDWATQPGAALDVGAGAAGVWSIGTTPMWAGSFNIQRFTGVSWVPVDGAARRIAVGDEPWVVQTSGLVYRRTGVTPWNPSGTSWQYIPGISAQDIGVASGQQPWAISNTPNGSGGSKIFRFNGSSWVEVPGAAVRIAVGDDGSVVVSQAGGLVYRRAGITPSNPTGSSWSFLGYEPGHVADVGVSQSGIIWVVGNDGGTERAHVLQEQSAIPGRADAFSRWVEVPLGAAANNIAVYGAHDPWLTRPTGLIRHRVK